MVTHCLIVRKNRLFAYIQQYEILLKVKTFNNIC